MFAYRKTYQSNVAELERIECDVRRLFSLDDDQIVLVAEEVPRLSEGPQLMTTILFWNGRDARHKVRIFKPVADVTVADLPPAWLQGALLDDGDADCC